MSLYLDQTPESISRRARVFRAVSNPRQSLKNLRKSARGRTILATLALGSVPISWAFAAQLTHLIALDPVNFIVLRSVFSIPMLWGAAKLRDRGAAKRTAEATSAPTKKFSWKEMDPAKRSRARRLIFGLALAMGVQGLFMTAALTTIAPAAAIIIMQMDTIPVMIRSLLKKEDKFSWRKVLLTFGVLGGAAVTLGVGGLVPISLLGVSLALGGMAASATRQILLPKLVGPELGIPTDKVLLPANAIDLGLAGLAVAATGGLAALNPAALATGVQWLAMAGVSAAAAWGFYAGGQYVRAPQNGVQPEGTLSPWFNSTMLTIQVPMTALIGIGLGQVVPPIGLLGVVATAGSMAALARAAVKKTPVVAPKSDVDAAAHELSDANGINRDAGRAIGHEVAREQEADTELRSALASGLAIGLSATGHDPAMQTHTPAQPVVQAPSTAEPKIGTGSVSSSEEPSLVDGLAGGLSLAWSTNPDLGPSEPEIDLTEPLPEKQHPSVGDEFPPVVGY